MTNSIVEFVRHLTSLSIELETDGDRLRCHAPEGVLTPMLRQEVARRKTEIMLFLQQAKQVKTSHQLPIQRVPRDGELPLSFAQQRLWFLHHLSPDSRSYNMLDAWRLNGSLNIVALSQSLSELIRRHEVLRTTFSTVDGKPVQVIAPPVAVTLPIHNLQGLSTQQQTAQIRQVAKSVASKPFDLAIGPLVQFTLLQLSDQEYVLLLKMHHIIYDAWSLNIFFNELSLAYAAFTQGLPNSLSELPIQYADFAFWQRQWLRGEVLDRQLAYWQKQLADAPTVLELPTDRPRPPVQSFRGGVECFQLDRDLTQRLKQLSQESETTLFMTLLAAFLVLLSRYSGQLDIVVGSPIANRNNKSVEQLIGFFANTLVLRGDLSGNPSFVDFLAQVRQTTLSAYAHQDLPFEMLVEKLQPERDLSRNPLVQVMFSLQNAPQSSWNLPGLTIQNISLPIDEMVRFDLEVNYWEVSEGLEGVWSYSTDLFDATTITRIAQHFQTLLKAIVANQEARIAELPLLSQAERHQLLVEWNNTQAFYPQDKCIHQLFEEQVAQNADAVAVVFEDQQLTYKQLNCRANQLAHYLRSLGVGEDVLVGICVERSPEMVVGLLGILKAGGAYVPLDPEYPMERLKFILEDAQVRVLLTQQKLVEKLPLHTAQLVCLDTDAPMISQLSQDNAIASVQASNLAYMIYTSGSTGTPKGVLIALEGLLNLVKWHQQTFQITSGDKATQLAGTGFDAAVWEIWPYLTIGASLYLVKSELVTEPVNLRDWLILHKITISFVPTPVAQELLSLEWTKESVALRYMLIGGDQLASYPSASLPFQVVNNYGPTENTVVTTSGPVAAKEEQILPTIGRPISNTQIYILDKYLQPVPIGVPGELHISGMGLARGYLNREELTSEKFIDNPFNNSLVKTHSSKLYKTGDLARYLPSGNIEYLGRIDNQVKIRGLRIELGEIEAVLSQHEDVQSSVVIAREHIPGNKRLLAYIVLHPQTTPTSQELRQFLKTKLPEYMVPSAIVILESLPLTPNGKIDRRALPVPETRAGIEVPLVTPRTPVEAKLAQIWSQVLRVEGVGIHDNFFSLGGDSILSIQIIAKAKLAGIELTVKQLFANQTIAQLATVALTTKALSIEQGLVSGTLPLTPIKHWFFEQNFPESHHFNQSFLLTVPSDIRQDLLEQVFSEFLKHHDALRLRFTLTQGTWQILHSAPTDVELCCFDFSTLPEDQLHTAIETTANSLQASLNLSENLLQVGLFRLGIDNKARLLIIIHHLVVDGVSWRILLEDLLSAYQQLSSGQGIQLPAKTTSFKDWAFQLLEYAQTQQLKSELAYWLSVSGAFVSPLPFDYAQGANTVASTSTISVSLTEAQTHSLLQDVPKAYKTQINDVLLTALVLVVSRWTNSKSVLFNLEGHGREDIIDGVDLSRTVGWFTTMFPVLVKLEVTDDLASAIKSVKEQLRAIPNKGIGYGLLRYLNVEPEISAQLQTISKAEISFNYLGQFSQLLNSDSLISLASESNGQSQSLLSQRSSLLDISAIVTNEQLQINWTYSSNIHQHSTIENLAQEFEKTLLKLIAHCLEPENVGYTPTDFPLIKLNQLELDGVLARLALTPKLGKIHWQNIEDIYALSPMQEGMLFESLYAPDEGVYLEQIICTFTGSVNVQAFEQAWQQVVVRHSIFRTAFMWESISQPLQVVYRQVPVSVQTLDWREFSKLEQQTRLESFLSAERQQGLQLSQAPVMRLHLLLMDDNTYEFVWCHHHILLDGWSFPLVFQDLLAFYQAISQGQTTALPPTVSYRNYIAWLQQQDLDLAKQFWRRKLLGFSTPTPLSVDKSFSTREQHSRSSYNEQQIHFTVSQTAAVVSFVRQHQLTMNNLVQVTWALLLSRYSGENDVVFGVTVSGRPPSLVGVESMVGLLINTLPVRMQISGETELLLLLKDLQAQQVESEQFSYTPLAEIQGFSDVAKGTSLFESIVVFENYPVDTTASEDNGSLCISNFRAIEQTNYPLTIIAGSGEQLWLRVSYDAGRFDHGTISLLLGHFMTMLSAIVANPFQRIDQLPLLTASEQHQLLVEWNNTLKDYACDKCIHQLFEEQVARTPDAVAVVFENEQLTYHQLNCRANQLAHYLRSMGVGADVLVGLCMERSLLMVIGLLAILKAGGAYVPLDPEYPTERLSYMLEDTQVPVLLTQQHLVDKLPLNQAKLVFINQIWLHIDQNNQDNVTRVVTARDLANVIYTSGSTGKPKGVMVEHQGLVNLAQAQIQTFNVHSHHRVLQFASLSFDASISEIIMALASGATLYMGTKDSLLPGMPLIERLRDYGITHITLPPSALAVLPTEQLPSLQTIIVAGEACDGELIKLWSAGRNFFNAYGPTEASVCATVAKCTSLDEKVTIGRPIANTKIYILDSQLQPVPIGVPGELHISGAGLARGYLNRLDLTQEKFIHNPFDKSKVTSHSSKLYKTGDKARYLPDGSIEYLGRIDNQVKIRGFRIELGEIEAVLSLHEDVQANCVIAREETLGDKRLVAYIVPYPQVTPTVSALRSFAKSKLPEYMIPNAFVFLEALPLTPNGKVDRRALPTLDIHSERQDKYVAPRNPTEEMLTQIWAQVLKVERVGRHDNFFTLGGHSLLATQLVSRIRNIFKLELPLRSLFATATVAELALSIQQLQLENQELTSPPILPRAENAELPLSFAQQRLWFLDQLEPLSASYNIPMALSIVGNLNIAALEQSLIEIRNRHEALRTNFIAVNGKAAQIIHTATNWTVSVVDLQHLPDSEQEIATKQLAQQIAIQPFDLSGEALLRVTLVVLSETEYVLLVCMHHIVSDGWSMGVLVAELAALYNAYSQGLPSLRDATRTPLEPLPIQYADFAIWQRQWLQGEVLKNQLSYWEKQLAGAPTFLPLPTDRPRGAVQTFAGAYFEFALSADVTQKLTELSQQQGCTLFMTLLAAFKTLLYRYTGQTDIVVGSPIANRNKSEIEGLIGFFVNTLILRTDLSGNPSFNELLLRLRSMALSAYAHQDLPFEMLVEALQPERNLSHTPLFQVMFVLQNAPISEVELDGLSISALPIEIATAKFDLTLTMENTNTGLFGGWEYNTDLFDKSTIERMTQHYVTLLEAIVANPQQRIDQLPLLTASESQQLLVEWNDTLLDYACDKCIHHLFEEQVQRTPDAVAVVFEHQQLTYRELNSRANQLAHYLRSMGVGADVLVGLCVERSLSMLVGLLGILKAGGAYVPLDPEYPTERLALILEDAQVKVLLTTHELADTIPKHQARVICYNNDSAAIALQSKENPTTGEVRSDCLAYVIYTSGSTGKPKGVSVTHRGVNRLVMNTNYIHIEPLDVIAQASNYAFDAATFEIWGALLQGARLFGVSKELALSPTDFAALIREQGISVLFLTTALFNQIAQAVPSAFNSLRYLLFGGEAVDTKWVQQVLKNGGPQRLLHVYGPTENTTFSSWYLVQDVPKDATTIPIGRPIANTLVYILDSDLQPVPVGVPGELHIAGAGLARGYLNRPDLTAEKFIPNPFDNSLFTLDSSKLYKTGDKARYLPSGNIEYLGRQDHQVKIRGFRIELGEIEAVLSQHELVQSSVVIAREDTPGNKRLLAYIVLHPQVTLTTSELRQFLKTKLPEYMVPSAIVILESLPLTPNGKIDRRALPVPETRAGIEVPLVTPRTPVEAKLAQIWSQVLRVEGVGIHDNFFSLGGDSILSIQIIAKAKLAGIELTVKQLFANQTIAQLATVALTTKALSIEQGLVSGTLPLTPIKHWFFEQNFPESHHFNQSFLLTVPSDIRQDLLEQVFSEFLKHHDALRLRFTLTQGTWQILHSAPTDVELCCFDFSTLPEDQLHTAIETTANSLQASLNLSENLLQVGLFRLGIDNKARLLIIIHHLVVDGVSWRILLEDLLSAYQQLSSGQGIQLPAKTTSFKDWAFQLLEYAQTQQLKSELAYWLSVSGAFVSPLPFDYAQGANTVASTSTISVSLTEAQTHSLLQDVPKAYKTQINDVLLTALVLVVSRWTNSKSVLFNLEGHGREDIIDGVDLSRTVGWFTTMFPVLVKLEVTDDLASAIKSVKEQLRAIPNKGIGYGLLRYLNVEPEISAQLQTISKAEISFNYLGQFSQLLNSDSLISLASESNGQSQSLLSQRSSLLDINAIVTNEQLQINWTYSSNIHQHSTIENLAQEFEKTLLKLIAHCLEPENVGYTPTDFPLIKLNQLELDGVLARLALTPKLGKIHWQNIEDIYALSPMQEGMLFESLYAPDEGVYLEQIICTFTGSVNVQAFKAAWQQVVARHSIFRTAFIWESISQPLQVVYRQVPLSVETIDLREFSKLEQQAQLESFLSAERQQGLQLSQAPVMRLHLLLLDANTYQFVWCHHHILLDGWSLPLVFKDLLEFYQAICEGESLALPPTVSYRNYIAWLQQQDPDLAQEFWRRKLLGFSTPTPLSVDKPFSTREQDSSYSEQQIHFTVSQTAAVVSFVRQHQLTMNNLVQVTWALLLSRYSGENDVVFGVTVSGRPPALVGVESMVGLLINTLPVRIQISPETELLLLLKDLQAQQVESEQFSYTPLAEIQALSDVPKGTSLFESIVVFENYPVDTTASEDNGSLCISNFRAIEQTNYPLTIIAGSGEQLWLRVSYDAGRFDHGTISLLLGHFMTMLSAIVANPFQRIDQLPLLTASEQQQLLVEWNRTQVDYPQDGCIHQLFEQQVARTPDAVAVVFEDQQLTYTQLNSSANQLAYYLQSLGVGPDVLVGICVERSLLMVMGLLGILKAGGAYVPLDPEYPTDRLRFMLEDAQVAVLLTQQQLVEKLPESQAQLVCLDTERQLLTQLSQENLICEVQGNNLGYMIYTSGSTGKPKGAMNTHIGICNRLLWMQQAYQLTAPDCVLQKTPFSFDVSVWEFFWPLLTGARLVLAQPGGHKDSAYLVNLILEQQVTTLHFVPSMLQAFIEEQSFKNYSSLKRVICSGEALPLKLQERFFDHLECELHNLYGPTEAAIDVTYWQCKPHSNLRTVPIGRPIANTQIYILDSHLQPVPIGVPGELHIGGVSLARGYLNRPDLTNEKFIPNPFSDEPHSRFYKTGDLARYLPDGNIEYLGRIDNQVKIRGFRIELGEIEATLSQHQDVEACCVIVREDTPGDKRLVAYVVVDHNCTPTINSLHHFLKAKLPDYMVPSAFVMLEKMPLTLSGKVDRRALPALEPSRELLDFVAPRTPIEEILALLWAQVLKVERVGRHDNFFSLGGHSLLATQLVSRVRSILKVELPLRSLFATPTIAELAPNIQRLQQQDLELSVPPILPRPKNAELPLSFAQSRLWFLDQLEPLSASYNLPMALRIVGNLNVAALEQSFIKIRNRHEALRTNFIAVDGKVAQIIHTPTNWTVSVVDLQHLPEKEQQIVCQTLVQQIVILPFDLSGEALLRATIVVLSETEHVLLVCMHHIVSDGWSMGVFVAELAALYNAYAQDQPSPLEPLPIQYADFAIWQRQWLQGEVLNSQLSYWEKQLAGAPTFLPLPTDRPRRAVQTFAGGYLEFALSVELTQKLTKLSQEQGCTVFMTLLAAFKTLLYRYSGQTDIVVGSPIANRNQSEIEGLIGFFVNTLVFRTNLKGNPSFNELLLRLRSMALSAYAHQDLPFEMLVEALQPERNLSHTPLFQVMFVLQNAPISEVELNGLSVSALPIETATAKFDLTLTMENTNTGLVGGWEYNTDLFDKSTIERMTGHFLTLLSAIVTNPQERIFQLPLLTASEQQQLLVEWNQTQADYAQDRCIHQLFEEQVARTPDAVAVVFEDQQLTYQQLNSRANQLAHYLQSLGVEADVLVGICVERSINMVVGLLGILKVGGTYVPLDPDHPQERLRLILEDAQVKVLLTQQHLVERLSLHQAQLVCLDTSWQLISSSNQKNPITGVHSSNLAYVIYTSGSTGQPKGVQISHNAVSNFLCAMQQRPGITKQDVLLGITTIAFDIAALEIFLPITLGACMVIARREETFNGRQLLDLLVKSQATIMQATPTTWRLLLEASYQFSHLKILCGGEALPWDLANQLLPRGASLWNLYGPTETTIWSSVYQVESKENLISIGRPIANTQFYILDQNLQPVPVGVPGELHIGGAGLARGYLNREELTSEKFIDNPFDNSNSKSHASKLYKTGDLARYLPLGNIEYLGRIDFQVKIRGFRIELGEIEAVLSQHEDVQSCVVIAREDTIGDQRLVAYIVPQPEQTPTVSVLRQFLKAKLPDYMVPSAIVILESLPLTPNGKVDRRALSVPSNLTASDTFVSPRNTVELQLVQIWSQILKVDLVGVKDNFFDLGGHSLLAPYLMAQIKQQFGKEIPLAMLFQHPTIEELASIVQKDTDHSSWSPLVAIQPTGSNPPFFCIPGAGGFPFYLYNLARYLGSDQPFYSFQAQDPNGEFATISKVEDIAAHYIQAMQAVQSNGPYFLGGHSFGGKVVFEIAQQLLRQGHVVALVAILDTTAPIAHGKIHQKPQELDDTKWLINIAKSLQIAFAKDLEMDAQPLPSLDPNEQLKYVLEYFHMLSVLPPDADTTYLKHLLQAYKAHHTVEYVPQQINPVPITLFRSSESVSDEPIVLPSEFLQDESWGWSQFSSEPVEIQFVPGNHVSMMTQPHVQVLAERLNACIKQHKMLGVAE